MDCQRSREIDLAEMLRKRAARRWSSFHDHLDGCAECRVELDSWIRLDALVRAATAPRDGHPSDDSLLALLENPRRLRPAEHRRVVSHLDACGPCRDALVAVAALG